EGCDLFLRPRICTDLARYSPVQNGCVIFCGEKLTNQNYRTLHILHFRFALACHRSFLSTFTVEYRLDRSEPFLLYRMLVKFVEAYRAISEPLQSIEKREVRTLVEVEEWHFLKEKVRQRFSKYRLSTPDRTVSVKVWATAVQREHNVTE